MKKDNKELATEKELMISKFWQAESVSSQLQEMNKQLFIEIDNLKVSVLKMSQTKEGQGLAALNPFLSHFS